MAPFNFLTVKEFMENNEEIPRRVLEDLQRELRKPRQELADLEAEIKDLEEQLTKLKLKRSQVEKHLAQYDCVLSPIRRLPADILHDIFYHCLPTRRDPIMNAKEAPLLLTRICRSWRQIAHSSPRLWTRLYITFSDEDIVEESQIEYGLSSQSISNMLRTRCSAIEEWFSCSGVLPLSVSLCYTCSVWISSPGYSPGNSDNTRTLFRILTQFSPRWQRIELIMPVEIYRIFEGMLSVSQLSMLTSVRTSLYRQFDWGSGIENEPDITLLQARNIQRISSSSSYTPTLRTALSHPNMTKITNLSFHWMITVTEAISLLSICPNLEYVWLNVKSDTSLDLPYPTQSSISLPYLRALCIADAIIGYSASRIYEYIDAPQLEWVDYTKQALSMVAGGPAPNPRDAVVALLEKSKKLRKLTIGPNELTTVQLRRILKSAPGVTHLVLGPERRTEENLLAASMIPAGANTAWDFRNVFLKNHEEETADASQLPLVPRLEVLEISQGGSTRITEDMLLDVILDREDLIASTGIAPLKKVVVLFSRPQRFDIPDEYRLGSKRTDGIDFTLEYPEEEYQAEVEHLLSSGYGMDCFDRSWKYRDLEEEVRTCFFLVMLCYLLY